MRIVNNSDGKPWYTQRNNELSPGSSCNVTSMVSGLVSAGWPLPKGKFRQDEDNLLDFIRSSPQVQRRWDVIDPGHKTPPNQIHELLCLGTNLWIAPMAGPPVTLRWDLRLADVVKVIDEGGAVVMSGRFKDHLSGEIGHIVAVVGYKANDNGNVTHVILDDPWGDYETLYKVQLGDDVYMPVEHWMSMRRLAAAACIVASIGSGILALVIIYRFIGKNPDTTLDWKAFVPLFIPCLAFLVGTPALLFFTTWEDIKTVVHAAAEFRKG